MDSQKQLLFVSNDKGQIIEITPKGKKFIALQLRQTNSSSIKLGEIEFKIVFNFENTLVFKFLGISGKELTASYDFLPQ